MIHVLRKYYNEPLYRNSIILMLNSALNALFGMIFWIIAARTISSEDIGLATAVISTATLITTLSRLGMDQGLVRYLPGLKKKSSFYTGVITINIVLALIITCVFLLEINVFSPALSFLRKGWFLSIFLAYIIISSIYSIQNVALIAIRRADLSMIQNLLLGVRIPAVIFLAPLGVLGVFSSFGTAFMLTILFGAYILPKYDLCITRDFNLHSIKKTLKFSLGNYSASIFMMAPVTIIPIIIVNTIGAEEGAYFYIAYSISALLFMIPNSVSTSLFVEGSHNLPLKENVLKSAKLILVILIPILIIVFFCGDKLLLLFSTEYSEESFEMLKFLAASSIFSSITSIFISIKKIQKDVSMINYIHFMLSVMIIGVGYIGILKYGLLGLGYAWLGANILICLVIFVWMIFKEKWGIVTIML